MPRQVWEQETLLWHVQSYGGGSSQSRMHGLLLTAVGKWLRKAQEHGMVCG